jgi:hypothetical protein
LLAMVGCPRKGSVWFGRGEAVCGVLVTLASRTCGCAHSYLPLRVQQQVHCVLERRNRKHDKPQT